jgi:hypothetical protein
MPCAYHGNQFLVNPWVQEANPFGKKGCPIVDSANVISNNGVIDLGQTISSNKYLHSNVVSLAWLISKS